ncbi:hypothetical protein [Leyella stercorea]|uniref:hypothetical protein n=1 Tax=Leyella stercorea TaxID=363265 RepID=UPI003A8F8F26
MFCVFRAFRGRTVCVICVDRCGHLRRPIRTSAPTDADICVDRCRHLRRPMRDVKV